MPYDMAKLTLTTSQLRYLQRLVQHDHDVLDGAYIRVASGEMVGACVPPKAEQVLAEQREMAASLLTKIDMAW